MKTFLAFKVLQPQKTAQLGATKKNKRKGMTKHFHKGFRKNIVLQHFFINQHRQTLEVYQNHFEK